MTRLHRVALAPLTAGALALLLIAPSLLLAQTALNSTTLAAAATDSAGSVTVASASTLASGQILFVDREAMLILPSYVSGATVVPVQRGQQGTAAQAHANASLVYTGVSERFGGGFSPTGSCTRAAVPFLPRIVLPAGDVYDCPVGTTPIWTLLNPRGTHTARSEAFNLDNGAGTTIDALLIRHPRPIVITACRIVYEDATTGTVAGGTAQVGTTVGGAQIVAATNYENTKAVGTTTAMVVLAGPVAAATPVLVRHTGVAVTQAGEAVVECEYAIR